MEQGQAPSTPPAAPEVQQPRTLSDFSRNFIATLDAENSPQGQSEEPQEPASEGASEQPQEQPQEESAEPVETQEATVEDKAPEVETEEVEIEGKLYAVPKELKDGYLRQADYTRKTQEVAQQRRVVEHLMQQAQQAVGAAQQFGDVLGQIKQAETAIESFHRLDWQALRESDPVEYATKQADYTRWQMHRQNLMQTLNSTNAQLQQAQAARLKAAMQEALPVLQEKIPGWGETKQREIRAAANRFGYSDEELAGLADPRAVIVLHKAAEYDKLMAKKVEASKQVASLPPVAKPSARPQLDQKAAIQKSVEKFKAGGGKDLNQMAGILSQRLRGK